MMRNLESANIRLVIFDEYLFFAKNHQVLMKVKCDDLESSYELIIDDENDGNNTELYYDREEKKVIFVTNRTFYYVNPSTFSIDSISKIDKIVHAKYFQ